MQMFRHRHPQAARHRHVYTDRQTNLLSVPVLNVDRGLQISTADEQTETLRVAIHSCRSRQAQGREG